MALNHVRVTICLMLHVFLTKSFAEEKKVNGLLQDPDLFEGDIQYPLPTSTFRNGIVGEYTKWSNNIVPYDFLDDIEHHYTDYEKGKLLYGMRTMEEELMVNGKKCIIFKPKEKEIGHLFFIRSQNSCSSPVGQPYTKNYVNLAPGCLGKSTIHHELMHSLGFFHEQSRPDRDDYITIHWENMDEGVWSQFKKQPVSKVTAYGEPYDLNSIMHYGYGYWSNNGKPTISVKHGKSLGSLDKLSIHDKRKIQKRYGCDVAPLPGGTFITTTTPRPTPGTGNNNVFSCNFDSQDWCGIKRFGSEQRWSIANDAGDHTTGSGYAARFTIRQDEVRNFDRNSDLSLTYLQPREIYCLSFWYKVNGYGNIKVKTGTTVVRSLNSLLDGWNNVRTTAALPTWYTNDDDLRIVTEIRSNEYGSIYIDDVQVLRGTC